MNDAFGNVVCIFWTTLVLVIGTILLVGIALVGALFLLPVLILGGHSHDAGGAIGLERYRAFGEGDSCTNESCGHSYTKPRVRRG